MALDALVLSAKLQPCHPCYVRPWFLWGQESKVSQGNHGKPIHSLMHSGGNVCLFSILNGAMGEERLVGSIFHQFPKAVNPAAFGAASSRTGD